MTQRAKTARLKNMPLNIIALLLGYMFWYMFGSSHTITTWITVPLSFYNRPAHTLIDAPESIALKIAGKRDDIRSLDLNQVAIHIDAQKLHEGKNLLTINAQKLLLPDTIKTLHCIPSNPIAELQPEKSQLLHEV